MLIRPDTDTHFAGIDKPFESANYDKAIELCAEFADFSIAIDGGAHIGSWTVSMADVFDWVIAFEPLKANYDCLVENTKDFTNVTTYMKAVGDSNCRLSMHNPVNPGNSGAGWVMDGDDFECITIDSLDLDELGFLKLDVEGYEPHAVSGAEETLLRCKPVVLVEQKAITARFGLPVKEAGTRLEKLGFKLRAVMNNDFIYST